MKEKEMSEIKYNDIIGLTPVKIEIFKTPFFTDRKSIPDTLVFTFANGAAAIFYHQGDCCESVFIEDINGDLRLLINKPLLIAFSSSSDNVVTEGNLNASGSEVCKDHNSEDCDDNDDNNDVLKWTFFHFRNMDETVTIRWAGLSNGYYSMDVDYTFYPEGFKDRLSGMIPYKSFQKG